MVRSDGTSGVGNLLPEDLCDEVVEVRRVSERIMVVVLMDEKQLIRNINALCSSIWTHCC